MQLFYETVLGPWAAAITAVGDGPVGQHRVRGSDVLILLQQRLD